MANSHYYKARARWAQAQLNWASDDIRALLVSTAYTVNLATHEFLSDIVAGHRIGTATALAGKAVVAADGRCTASSPVAFSGMPSSGVVGSVVLYKHTGTEATSPLLIYMDTAVSGLPLTMTGADVRITLPAAGLLIL